ncbi:MAG: hypothetical protein M3494_06085 [Actinomycetota bacterium]|nr:hypothetical protein [Rubrobacter sp.]MDQ3507568.1 hypothetical protein [Actinomycetota bacterium]
MPEMRDPSHREPYALPIAKTCRRRVPEWNVAPDPEMSHRVAWAEGEG